jgi:hypothetical protein
LPINKEKERFVQEKLPFEMVSRDVVHKIQLPEALAIWVYLITLPSNWVPRREQLRERFDLGRDRYGAAMKELRDLGLVWDAIVRDGQGKIVEKVMTVQALFDSQRESLVTGKPTSRVYQPDGQTDHLKNKRLLKEKDITKGRFTPPSIDEVAEYCKERGNNVNPANFIDHYEANGWMRGKAKIKCWKACVRTWEKNDTNTAKANYL